MNTMQVQGGKTLITAAVADGIGGYPGGQQAAADAVQAFSFEIIARRLITAQQEGIWDPAQAVLAGFHAANDAVICSAMSDPDLADMGTTLTAGVIDRGTFHLASVGDSRCYRLCRVTESLCQLTHDDSALQDLIDRGEEPVSPLDRLFIENVITNCLGHFGDLKDLEVASYPLEPGDIILVCSDGLWKHQHEMLEAECTALAASMFDQKRLEVAAQTMVEKALEAGSMDNVTIALCWADPMGKENGTCKPHPTDSNQEED
ncbi:MAG: serine/threonine-protein phosphatase [Candidatus Hydrogenedentes bacterium]|nr:serine/threonine-protein phosphatase [Candidatus Hydrogenedentota bacterium]